MQEQLDRHEAGIALLAQELRELKDRLSHEETNTLALEDRLNQEEHDRTGADTSLEDRIADLEASR